MAAVGVFPYFDCLIKMLYGVFDTAAENDLICRIEPDNTEEAR